MNRILSVAVAAVLTIAAPLPVLAQAGGVTLGKPGYGGPGCPGGSAAIALSNGGKNLTIKFKDYRVRAKAGSFDRKACSLTIPVKVPAGKALFVIGYEYKGIHKLPSGSTSKFEVEYFFPGSTGPKLSKEYTGPRTGSFSFDYKTYASSVVKTGCGASVNLRVNTSLNVKAVGGEASASIRTADVNTAMLYKLELRNC